MPVFIRWNANIIDSDNHTVWNKEGIKPSSANIHIGNHVWFCAYAHLLKNTKINDNSVVAYNSCVFKDFSEPNLLIGGYPARILETNIDWKG